VALKGIKIRKFFHLNFISNSDDVKKAIGKKFTRKFEILDAFNIGTDNFFVPQKDDKNKKELF
jgi:hypothetical protein